MSGLIISLISIALLAALMMVGINHLNIQFYENETNENTLIGNLQSYEISINTYYKTFNIYPQTDTWEEDIERINLIIPDNSNGFYSYEYDTSNNTIAFCYDIGVLNEDDYEVIESVHERGLTIMGNSCFIDSDETIDNSTYPVQVALTRWIKK